MPSPIAHIAVGCLTCRRIRLNLWLCAFFSILPDLDFLPGILFKDPAGWHGTFSHSFAALFVFGCLVFCFVFLFVPFADAMRLAFSSMLIYSSHILLDFFTYGRGIMLLWPMQKRFISPIPFFIGLRWSDPFASFYHILTILNEGLFVIAIVLFVCAIKNIRLIITRKQVNFVSKACN